MCRFAMVVVLLLASPAAAEVHVRVRPATTLSGGWTSDLFLGADLGSGFQGLLAPSLEVDLSLLPRLKLFGGYDGLFGLYQQTGGTSAENQATLGGRVRIGPGLWVELAGVGAVQDLTVAQSVDDALGLNASRTLEGGGTAGVRLWLGRFLLELGGQALFRQLVLETGEAIDDRTLSANLGAAARLGPVTARLGIRGVSESSTAPSFVYQGVGATLLFSVPVSLVTLRASGEIHHNIFALGRRDTLLRASLTPSVTVASWSAGSLSVEASYSFATNTSTDAGHEASRHYVSLGFRVEGAWRD